MVLKAYSQEDSLQLKTLSGNPHKVNDGSFLEVYNFALNSNFPKVFKFLRGFTSMPITTGNSHGP